MAHQIIPQAGSQSLRGEVFLSSLKAGGYVNVPIGIVQDFEWDDMIDLKELRGPRSRNAISVLQSGAKLTGSCKFASTNAQILAVVRGAALTKTSLISTTGTVTSTATVTIATRSGTDNVVPCGVELFDVDNENGPHVFFYNVLFADLKNPMKLDDYTIWDLTFNAYPDVASGKLYDVYYPGDQTTAFTLPTQYSSGADPGLTAAETGYVSATTALRFE